MAVVLDRTPPEAVAEVSGHLARMLTSRGLRDSPLFTVAEAPLNEDGSLPLEAVKEIRDWLHMLAADSSARAAVVKQTLDGAVRSVARRSHAVADAGRTQVDMTARLRAEVVRSYDQAIAAVDEACADGTLLRGEVLARWQEFVGTGELLRSLETRVGWVRDRVVGWVRGKPQQAEQVTVAVEAGLESLILEHAEAAAEQTDASWRSLAAGQGLLDGTGADLSRASRGLRLKVERAVRDWQTDVLEMVRNEGADKRSTARFLAFGVNGLSIALMVVVFSQTAGLSGAEAGIAGGSAVLGQKLLEAVFGDQAVRRLAEAARADLARRVQTLMDGEKARYFELLDGLGITADAPEKLREAARAIEDLRFAEKYPPGGSG